MKITRRTAAALAGCLVAAAGLAGAGLTAAAAAPVSVGVYVPGGAGDPGELDAFQARTGRAPVLVHSYKDWERPPFEVAELNAVWQRGSVPLISWEPWSWTDPGRSFPLRAIAEGRFDSYVRGAARTAAAWGNPIFLRFAHEMNGRWYPWGAVGANTPADYRDAWRHVVDVFYEEGARNVRWVWSPYASTILPFRRYFPGDRWVHWAALDGFNWGATRGEWQSFSELFRKPYEALIRFTRRPVMIAETGSVEQGAAKPRWISRALGHMLPRLNRIRAIVWWDDVHNDGPDFRLDTSSAALDALRSGLAARRYRANRKVLLETPRRLPR